jgi:predicted transposase YdaD
MKHVLEVVVDRMKEKFTRNGKRKKALEIAEKMKAKGESIDEIIEMTDLTVDEVLQL